MNFVGTGRRLEQVDVGDSARMGSVLSHPAVEVHGN